MAPDLVELGKASLAQIGLIANLYFWKTTDYFDGPSDEKPLLHTWSLAVEEQFYLAYPILLAGLFRFRFVRRESLRSPLGLLALASFLLSLWSCHGHQTATFYLLPTRAWEILLGGLFAVCPFPASLPRSYAAVASRSSLPLMLAPMWIYDQKTHFPGVAALPPCIGAGLFLWSAEAHLLQQTPAPLTVRCLSLPLFTGIGRISYSLYLWHWPLFAYTHYWALSEPSAATRVLIIFASFVLAFLSWRFVESPFRHPTHAAGNFSALASAGGSALLLSILALGLVYTDGVPQRFSESVKRCIATHSEKHPSNRPSHRTSLADARSGKFPVFGVPNTEPPALFVWGDSHARCVLPVVDRLARQHGLAAASAWYSSTPPVLDYLPTDSYSLGREAPVWNQTILEHIAVHRIGNVLLVAKWNGYISGDPSETEAFLGKLEQTVSAIRQVGAVPWIVAQVPAHDAPVPKLILHNLVHHTDISPYVSTLQRHLEISHPLRSRKSRLERLGAKFVDPSYLFAIPASDRYAIELNGNPLYFDEHHLTRAGAARLTPVLTEVFLRAESGNRSKTKLSTVGLPPLP